MQQQRINLADLTAWALPKLKAIAKSRHIAPDGDKRRKDVWMRALENNLMEEMTLGELKAEVALRDGLGSVEGDKRLKATWMEALRRVLHPEEGHLGQQQDPDNDLEPERIELAGMKLKALKAMAREYGVVPQGDKRRREVWIQAVADVYTTTRYARDDNEDPAAAA